MQTPRDENHVPIALATSDADGVTPVSLVADPATHGLFVEDGVLGSDLSDDIARRDENHVTTIMAVSSVDGITPVPLYIDSATGKLLIQSS